MARCLVGSILFLAAFGAAARRLGGQQHQDLSGSLSLRSGGLNDCDEDMCREPSDCTVLSWSCGGCDFCRDGYEEEGEGASESHGYPRPSSACPSYCSLHDACDLYPDTCTPQRCPEICSEGSRQEQATHSEAGSEQESEEEEESKPAPSRLKKPSMPEGVAELMAELDGMVGLETVKFQMKELLAQVQFDMERKKWGLPEIGGQSLHMAFMGNPGTGKTVLARIVGELMIKMGAIKSSKRGGEKVVTEVARADLVAEYVGQTALKVKTAIDKAKGGVLFIDEAYSLVQGQRDSFGQEALDTLIKEMEDNRDELIVILAGYKTEMNTFIAANPGFKSRVAFHFTFTDYTCPQLVQIGETLLKKDQMGLSTSSKPVCSPADPAAETPVACGILHSAVTFVTGCCETTNCGKPENRANGNGRSVRNILESSYRSMARRVLNTYSAGVLEEVARTTHVQCFGFAGNEDCEPRPALECSSFDKVRYGGPYMNMSQLGSADVRCAFKLLEQPDIHAALTIQVKEQLVANCRNGNKPITVDADKILTGDGFKKVDMEKLHTLLFQDRVCEEAQEMLSRSGSASLLQQSFDDDWGELFGDMAGYGGQEDERPGSQVEDLMKELNELVGLDGVKAGVATLRDSVEYDMWRKKFLGDEASLMGQSFHMRFLGNPGTGKTVVARIVGQILVALGVVKKQGRGGDGFRFTEGSRMDMVGAYLGQTALKVQKKVKEAFGGVLFIDEAYSLVSDDRDSFGQEAVDSLIKEMEDNRDKLVVILAGYHHEMEAFIESNPGFKSRVPFRFEFADYTCEELGYVGAMMLAKQNVTTDDDARSWLDKVIAGRTGCCSKKDLEAGTCAGARRDNGNGRAVRNILESALRAMSTRVVVAHNSGGQVDKVAVSSLKRSDIATAGAEMIADALRASCKAGGKAVPNLEELVVAPRILGLPDFKDALTISTSDCTAATQLLESAKLVDVELTPKAAEVQINDPRVQPIFEELDQMIGLASVKRAMRELYCTVAFKGLREQFGLKELNSQSFHMRFLGNPGTGKTVMARIVGRLLVALGAIKKPEQKVEREYGMDHNPYMNPPGQDSTDGYGYDSEEESSKKKKGKDDIIWNEASRMDLVAEYMGQTAIKTMQLIDASMGGVLFIDEAYALVQGDRDTFGQEAVATLIKEMEDRRENVIVICAGYEHEMETFFDSNPGFKSRVPFTFHFEDYTCPELGKIGEIQLEQKQLVPPQDMAPFSRAIHFGTGCCDRLEDCKTNKNYKGNGRAVRNMIEASIRAMARRLMSAETHLGRDAYMKMQPEDFNTVTKQLVFSQFSMPCGKNGDIDKITQAVRGFEGVLRDVPKDKRAYFLDTVRRIATDSSLVVEYGSMPEVQALGTTCRDGVRTLSQELAAKLSGMCSSDGVLDKLVGELHKDQPRETTQDLADTLRLSLHDQAFMLGLLEATTQAGGGDANAVQLCEAKQSSIGKAKFPLPLDYLIFAAEAAARPADEPEVQDAY